MALGKPTVKYFSVYKKTFCEGFPCILSSRKGEHFTFCALCRSDFSILHAWKGDVKHTLYVQWIESNKKLDVFRNTNHKKDSVTNAECLFICADHSSSLFRMFSYSEIAQKYGCARTNTCAIMTEIANSEEQKLVSTLYQGNVFSLTIDGSNDSDA
ncbi:hypothetical protein PR048_000248 [Dryococelus australis]|uniref:Uncharacterized protein n=1 Tax=Dryococelus australis TaxID=614101 RepID=A0ABQ9IE54_9NEOP|nr:hypothetical protein PR048_000248 [Dryococelus australis]